MTTRHILIGTAALFAAIAAASTSVQALTTKECSTKYQAAKTAGTLNGMKWNDFRKAQCGSDATAAPAATPASVPAAAPPPAPKPPKTTAVAPKTTPASTPPAASTNAPASAAVFPAAVSPKYSKESAGKARMHTCLDQYNTNKADNGNGGLVWTTKGGGYYSECNKRLKG